MILFQLCICFFFLCFLLALFKDVFLLSQQNRHKQKVNEKSITTGENEKKAQQKKNNLKEKWKKRERNTEKIKVKCINKNGLLYLAVIFNSCQLKSLIHDLYMR